MIDHLDEIDEQQDEPGPPPEVLAFLGEREKTWQQANVLLSDFLARFEKGQFPKPFKLDAFSLLEVGPGCLTAIGAPPATGKTASAMQIVFEILRENPVSAYVANSESAFDGIVMRELSRRSGVGTSKIRRGDLSVDEKDRLFHQALLLGTDLERVKWLGKQFSTEVLLELRKFPPGLLVVDYLQKCAPATGDTKGAIQSLLNELRELARIGWAVLILSATNRSNGNGNKQQSFRDSSEVEYQADFAYVMQVDEGQDENALDQQITFCCVKNRWDRQVDVPMVFHKSEQRFEQRYNFAGDFAVSSDPFA